MVKRILSALGLALAACILPWSTGWAAGTTLTFGGVISAINSTPALVGSLPPTVQSVTLVDVSPVVRPSDPYHPNDPYRTSYDRAIYRSATAIVTFRGDLSSILAGSVCTPDGCFFTPVDQLLADAGVPTDTVVTGALSQDHALTIYYDSQPDACVTTPGEVCLPPSPI